MRGAYRFGATSARLNLDLRASDEKFRNPAFHRLPGYEPRDLYKRALTVLRLVHPDDRDRIAALLPAMLAGQALRSVEFRLLHADGTSVRRVERRRRRAVSRDGKCTAIGGAPSEMPVCC